MEPATRYRKYLSSFGINDPEARITVHAELTLGELEFYSYQGADYGPLKAAVSPEALVASGARPEDGWHALLSAGDAAAVASRIAWLETDDRVDPHRNHPKLRLLQPGGKPPVVMDPAHWQLVAPPTLARAGDALVLTAWFLAGGQQVPVRWKVSARAGEAATIDRRSAAQLVKPTGSEDDRARTLLTSGTSEEKRWALERLATRRDRTAVPAVARLLGEDDGELREAAAATLGSIGDPAAIPALGRAYEREEDQGRRAGIVQALAHLGDPAVEPLAAMAETEEQSEVRLEIVHALARIGGDRARAALEKRASADPDPAVAKLARTYSSR